LGGALVLRNICFSPELAADMLAAMPESPSSHDPVPTAGRLRPVLGLVTATAIVVGATIGSGIFRAPRQVALSTGGSVGLILTLWVVCGLVNLCGALTLAELSAMYPQAGGTYVFLREGYGRVWAFLWAWAEFWVIRSGSIAALSVAMTLSLVALLEGAGYELAATETRLLQQSVAIGAIVLLTAVNILGVRWGGWVQNATTAVKAAFVGFLALLPFLAIGHETVPLTPLWPADPLAWNLWAGIGGALALIMFTYDGWGNVTVVAEEIRDPERNLPWSLAGGVLFLIMLYVGANLAYHLTLPTATIATAAIPAVTAAEELLPGWGAKLTLGMMMVSVFGALNANVLVGPRVLFAVGRDAPLLGFFRYVDPRFGTPVLATAAISGWSIVLILFWDYNLFGSSGTDPAKPLYELLVDYVIFSGSLFYLAAVLTVFVLRITRPDALRPYRTWGYPVVPAIFVVFYLFLLGTLLWSNPWECLSGLFLIGLGLVIYGAQALLARRKP
jgi:APA family basic amino acid/polyamine antiporter